MGDSRRQPTFLTRKLINNYRFGRKQFVTPYGVTAGVGVTSGFNLSQGLNAGALPFNASPTDAG
jgi:hypothetical protein